MNAQHALLPERISPLPLDCSISSVLGEHYTTEELQVLEADDAGWHHHRAIPHSASLYLLVEYRRGLWACKRTLLIVDYHLFDIGAGRQELRFSACPEHQASSQTAHTCPLTLLERLSPTQDGTARAWRSSCWKSCQDQAARSVPASLWNLSLPSALAISEHAQVMRIHASRLYVLAWQGSLPRYGDPMHGIVHIQEVVHMGGIADPESVVPVGGLHEAIDVFLEKGVPLSTGWFPC